MSAQQNIQIVKDAYAAFGRGDMQSLLALLADEVDHSRRGIAVCRHASRPGGSGGFLSEDFRNV